MAGELSSLSGVIYDNLFSGAPNPGIVLGRLLALYGSSTRGYNKVVGFGVKEELMTIAAAANSESALTSFLPANSIILAVTGRVTVAIPTATTFTIGDPSAASRFGSGIAVAANTTFVAMAHWSGTVALFQSADAKVRITPDATPANANGRVAVQVAYFTVTPPTA